MRFFVFGGLYRMKIYIKLCAIRNIKKKYKPNPMTGENIIQLFILANRMVVV